MATIQPVGNFTPTLISGCTLWLDGNDPNGTGITPNYNTVLTTWVDKSGNGRNATGGLPPTFVNGGVSFNGTTTYLNMSIPYSSNYSIFLVGTNTTAPQCYFFGRTGGPGSSPTFIQGYIGAGIGLEWYEAADRATIATSPSSPFLASVNHTQGTNITGFYFGTQSFSISQTQAYLSNAWDFLGAASATAGWYGGTMKELIFYGSVVTTSQRQQVEGYLAWKWGLQTSLPSNHPYRYVKPYAPGYSLPTSITLPTTSFQLSSSVFAFFKPTQISGCSLWLDAADPNGNGSIPANGASISTWSDKSGNGYNGTSSGTSTFLTGRLNNLPGIQLSGTNYFTGTAVNTVTTLSVFTVFDMSSTNGAYSRIVSFSSPGQYDYDSVSRVVPLLRYNNNQAISAYRNSGDLDNISITYNTPFIGESLFSGTTNTVYRNGTPGTGVASSGSFNYSLYAIANGAGLNLGATTGYVYEVLVYNAFLTTTQRQTVEGYLAWKWGLQSSLPSNHPYKNTIPGLTIPVLTISPSFQPASFRPTQISGLQMWLDAADPNNTGVVPVNGVNITQWVDKSGNGNNANAHTSNPTFATNIQNSLPGIQFSGGQALSAGNIATGTAFSLFTVLRYTNTSGTRNAMGFWKVQYSSFLILSAGQSVAGQISATGANSPFGTGQSVDTNPHMITGIQSSDTVSPNGYLIAGTDGLVSQYNNSGGPNTNACASPFTVGALIESGTAYYFMIGYIHEVIFYRSILTTAQRQSVEGYLAWKWGLQGNLPSNHPFKKFPPPPS